MNINENLKRRANPLDKGGNETSIEPLGAFLMMPNVSIRPLKSKKIICYSKQIHFGNVRLHGFHGNTLYDIKEWGCTYIILISQQQLMLEH